jgi:hypothetical protein
MRAIEFDASGGPSALQLVNAPRRPIARAMSSSEPLWAGLRIAETPAPTSEELSVLRDLQARTRVAHAAQEVA